MAMVAQHCECTNATELYPLKLLILCEFHLNKQRRLRQPQLKLELRSATSLLWQRTAELLLSWVAVRATTSQPAAVEFRGAGPAWRTSSRRPQRDAELCAWLWVTFCRLRHLLLAVTLCTKYPKPYLRGLDSGAR